MCISGICRKVGCDWAVDSKTTEDQCGICGGNGENCTTIKVNLLYLQLCLNRFKPKIFFRESSTKNSTYLMATMNSKLYHLVLVIFSLKNLLLQKVLLQFQNLVQTNSI